MNLISQDVLATFHENDSVNNEEQNIIFHFHLGLYIEVHVNENQCAVLFRSLKNKKLSASLKGNKM